MKEDSFVLWVSMDVSRLHYYTFLLCYKNNLFILRNNKITLYHRLSMVSATPTYSTSLILFIAVTGIIILFIQPSSTSINVGPASASLWGYGMIMMATLGIMFSSFAILSKMEALKTNTSSFVKSLLTQSIPSLLLIGLLTWLIVLNAQYFKPINTGEVASEYSTYSNVSFFLILIQLWIAYNYMQSSMKSSSDKIISDSYNNRLLSITYLLTITNSMVILIMNIILKYFSTDG